MQFEEHNGHYVFTPPMVENPVIITLPPEAEYVTIVREGNITQIYATDRPVVEGWVVG